MNNLLNLSYSPRPASKPEVIIGKVLLHTRAVSASQEFCKKGGFEIWSLEPGRNLEEIGWR